MKLLICLMIFSYVIMDIIINKLVIPSFNQAKFDYAMQFIIEHEGGYNNIKGDSGGATNYGLSIRFMRTLPEYDGDVNGDGHVDIEDIKNLTADKAKSFYLKYFYNHYSLHKIYDINLSAKVFDLLVNMRSVSAIKIVQRALLACQIEIKEDGILGSQTFNALNAANAYNLIIAIRAEQASFYRNLVRNNNSLNKFLLGWLRRAYNL